MQNSSKGAHTFLKKLLLESDRDDVEIEKKIDQMHKDMSI
jgi:hypothetical protein